MKFKFIGLMISLILLSVATVSAADVNETAQTDIVEEDALNDVEIDETIASFDELQKLIDSNSTIELDKDYSIELGGSTLKISKDLTINGNGHCLDGDGKTRIMKINGGHVTLNNIIFENGVSNKGGAIYSEGELNIKNCVFQENTANDDNGGAIYTTKKLYIADSKFLNNQAYVDGGAVYGKEGTTIENSVFKTNAAKGSSKRCFGGAVRIEKSLTIDGCEFNNNYAEDHGGAIYSDNIKFTGENTFIGNIAENYGGAVYTNTISGDVEYVTFKNNQAKTDDGGAIYINKEYDGTFTHCFFEKNHAGQRGGAIYVDSCNSDITLTKNAFIGNTAVYGNSGYTCNSGGWIGGVSFILGPNWYGDTSESSREGQFYYKGLTFLSSSTEIEVESWLNDIWEVFA